jgi:hypothetical protein
MALIAAQPSERLSASHTKARRATAMTGLRRTHRLAATAALRPVCLLPRRPMQRRRRLHTENGDGDDAGAGDETNHTMVGATG